MRIALAALLYGLSSAVLAQDAVPDLTGMWVGKAKAVVFGNNQFHPGSQTAGDPPRVRELDLTMEITGQDGRVLWGQAWATANPDGKETLALAIASDGKTIVGADNDGAHYMTIVSPDRIERCYAHPGISPSESIVASCGFYERVK
jgi:hypothetical protein